MNSVKILVKTISLYIERLHQHGVLGTILYICTSDCMHRSKNNVAYALAGCDQQKAVVFYILHMLSVHNHVCLTTYCNQRRTVVANYTVSQ